jgi:hypothetical protein
MKRNALVLTAVALLTVAVACFASDSPFIGTWKLNEAKSKFAAGAPKNSSVVYSMAGADFKVVIDGTDASGQPVHESWTGKFDGKDYPVTGNPNSDMRSYQTVNSHTIVGTTKKDGKVQSTARVVVSADGKTRTVTFTATDAKGVKQLSSFVYDKQ